MVPMKICTALMVLLPAAMMQSCTDTFPSYCSQMVQWCAHPQFQQYLKQNCMKSCNLCQGPGTLPPATNGPNTGNPGTGTCGKPSITPAYVISGRNANPGSWPWQALLLFNGQPGCGGSLISSQWVVTAAHCVEGKEQQTYSFQVVLGEHDTQTRDGNEQQFGVQRIIKHASFSMQTFDADIALLKLDRAVTFNSRISTVCLPSQGQSVPTGTECYITGWGKITHPGGPHHVLQQARLKVTDSNTCQYKHAQSGLPTITRTMVCAGDGGQTRKSGCHGDSGGPFVCRTGASGTFELHGAVSHGSPSCDSTKSYTVLARVSELRQWIDQNAQ